MRIGFFFWPFHAQLITNLGELAERYELDLVGIADTPGNAMDPWVSAPLLARAAPTRRLSICVTNLVTRHPSVTAAAAASLAPMAPGGVVLGIGAGHSGTRNLGLGSSNAQQLRDGTLYLQELTRGRPATLDGHEAQLSWATDPLDVFLAASHPRSLRAAAEVADGVFVNFGLHPENVQASRTVIDDAVAVSGRNGPPEIWQVAAFDCSPDGRAARQAVGAMLAFLAGYVIGTKDLDARGVPTDLQEPLLELRRRYSTRPSSVDAALVRELGLFDYLAGRLAVCGDPDECTDQILRAHDAGVDNLMFTVSLAADPVAAVRLLGERVLPALRSAVG